MHASAARKTDYSERALEAERSVVRLLQHLSVKKTPGIFWLGSNSLSTKCDLSSALSSGSGRMKG